MAAGLGTRLRPLTYEVPKPMVPVGNRPVMELLLRMLAEAGHTEVIANLHWFPDTVRDYFGDGSGQGVELAYSYEPELLGTAGGVRNVADWLTETGEPCIVMAGDALTDIDLDALLADHRANGGIATMAVKRVTDVSQYGVVVVDGDGRVQGFQEKPDPAEALSDLVNTMIYVLEPEIFDHFPEMAAPDFAHDVFPGLLDTDVPFHVHEMDGYWNDVGSLGEYLQGNLDVVEGAVKIDAEGELVTGEDDPGDPTATGSAPEELGTGVSLNGTALIGAGAIVSAGARIDGPCVIGPGSKIGGGSRIKRSVILPGTQIPDGTVLSGGVAGTRPAQ